MCDVNCKNSAECQCQEQVGKEDSIVGSGIALVNEKDFKIVRLKEICGMEVVEGSAYRISKGYPNEDPLETHLVFQTEPDVRNLQNEDLINILINRISILDQKHHSNWNDAAINVLRVALFTLNARQDEVSEQNNIKTETLNAAVDDLADIYEIFDEHGFPL